jgi:hypothetical protein
MGWRSLTYRPSHTAHGGLYRTVTLVPFAIVRACGRLWPGRSETASGRARRLARGEESARPARIAPAPPLPPPPAEMRDLWRVHEGQVTPQWLDPAARTSRFDRLRRLLHAG